ncbi:MAG: signal peptidase II [Clostridiales bacterium]|nr:signal peptidase II [Clostridiales bacterium]
MIYILLAAVIVAVDALFKKWIVLNITLGTYHRFVPGIIGITHLRNDGAAFSILAGRREILLVLTALFIAFAVVILLTGRIRNTWGCLGLSMVLGGAAGNAVDRLAQGYVVDMFSFEFVDFAIFNIADCFITIGGIVFCLYIIIAGSKSDKEKKTHPSGGPGEGSGGVLP